MGILRFRDFKIYEILGSHQSAFNMNNITCLQLYHVTCSELTINGKVEQCKIAIAL
jgi:hypothetical protein